MTHVPCQNLGRSFARLLFCFIRLYRKKLKLKVRQVCFDFLCFLKFCSISCHLISGFWLRRLCRHLAKMPLHLSKEKKSFLVINYARTQSSKATLDLYAQRFPGDPLPAKSTPKRVHDKFEAHGTTEYMYPKQIRRPVSILIFFGKIQMILMNVGVGGAFLRQE